VSNEAEGREKKAAALLVQAGRLQSYPLVSNEADGQEK
jgi:hypothetical protein